MRTEILLPFYAKVRVLLFFFIVLCLEGDESCIKYVKLYLHYAKECNGVNQIQLALHECAFIHLGFAQVSKEHLLEVRLYILSFAYTFI